MRTVIIVLIVIAVAFVAVAVLGVRRTGDAKFAGAPPQKDGKVDQDALVNWTPPSMADLIARISGPFAPKLELPAPKIALPPGASDTRTVPSSSSRLRVARITLKSGAGLRIQYACLPQSGRQCPELVCICSPSALFTALQISSCPESWRRKRMSGEACVSNDDHHDDQASFAIYPETGALEFTALGPTAVTAEVE